MADPTTLPVLPVRRTGAGGTTLVLMHFFGSSKRAWSLVTPVLDEKFDCCAIDLPGFGEAHAVGGYAVAEMAASVRRTVETLNAGKVVLVGHSMSGKVAAVIAAEGLDNLAGLVLVTPSPPEPEPMTDGGRERLSRMGRNARDADAYFDAITAAPLKGEPREHAVADFVRANPRAWSAWLDGGSREDWSARVGTLGHPALLVTGRCDPSLPLAAQKATTLRHVPDAQVEDIPACGHVPMLECGGRLAGVVARFAERL